MVASLEDLRLLLSVLKDVETAQRGYLITGHDEFLEPLQSGIPTTRQKLRAVRAFGLAQAADLDRLERLVERKIEFLENSIRVRKVRGFDAAAAIVGTGEGPSSSAPTRRPLCGGGPFWGCGCLGFDLDSGGQGRSRISKTEERSQRRKRRARGANPMREPSASK